MNALIKLCRALQFVGASLEIGWGKNSIRDSRRAIRLAIGGVLLAAFGSSAARAGDLQLKCSGADAPNLKLFACKNPHELHEDGSTGWKDAVVLELQNFPYIERPQGIPSLISHYWFTESGKFMSGKVAFLQALDGGPIQIRSNRSFDGRLSLPGGNIIPPGR